MAEDSLPGSSDKKKLQVILIVVLGGILLGVILFGQPAAESEATDAGAVTARRTKTVSDESKQVSTNWPNVSLDEMLEHNPFQELETGSDPLRPGAAATAEPEPVAADEAALKAKELEEERRNKLAALIADWKNQRVKMILRTEKTVSAVIGDRVIHEGEVLDGIRIVSILPDGVLVEPDF